MNTPTSAPGSAPAGAADDVFEWEGASGRLSLRLYAAGPRKSEALMVFLPPGGFVMADLDAADDCLKSFAVECGVTILAPSYAVAPEHPFPAAIEDAHAVLRLTAARGSRMRGWTGRHLIVGGIEAGGNLAAVGALMSRDRLGPKLAGQVLLMPMLDPSMREVPSSPFVAPSQAMTDAFRDYLPRASDRVHPYACPLESSRMAGLPPALIVHVDGDALAAGAVAYADKLERAGVPVQRLALPPTTLAGTDERCEAAGSDACSDAVRTFLSPFTRGVRPHPAKSVASALHEKKPEASHD